MKIALAVIEALTKLVPIAGPAWPALSRAMTGTGTADDVATLEALKATLDGMADRAETAAGAAPGISGPFVGPLPAT